MMRQTILCVALAMLAESTYAFQSPNLLSRRTNHQQHISTSSLSSTSADILARARKAAGVEEEQEEEKIFDDALLEDMQQCLITLETRVKEGAGSIPLLEIEQLQAMATNILTEMKAKENERLATLSSGSAPAAAAVAAAAVPPQQLEGSVVSEVSAPAAPAAQVASTSESAEVANTSEDDGPAYEGKGGMGLAAGTANTWVIEGMDSMSPEEYQEAIQASISARQAARKESGVYGNRNSNDYLNTLNGAKGGGMLK
ncbi:unnamed protein product [Cylindrotheca closterium]|uniref:PS II complex 12 kDa extrinsic protein n=1 Tax=Cylindrotheca closterium TaxID=2856 RepID=A0AAD2JJ55_9STRA|nr:unnamed protein product [Cylindrotheca closterium]